MRSLFFRIAKACDTSIKKADNDYREKLVATCFPNGVSDAQCHFVKCNGMHEIIQRSMATIRNRKQMKDIAAKQFTQRGTFSTEARKLMEEMFQPT